MPRNKSLSPSTLAAGAAEEQLARRVHSLADELVVSWGHHLNANGADFISFNARTGRVTLLDNKNVSGAARRVQPSTTFAAGSPARTRALDQAKGYIDQAPHLSPTERQRALDALKDGDIDFKTAGSGNAKNTALSR